MDLVFLSDFGLVLRSDFGLLDGLTQEYGLVFRTLDLVFQRDVDLVFLLDFGLVFRSDFWTGFSFGLWTWFSFGFSDLVFLPDFGYFNLFVCLTT